MRTLVEILASIVVCGACSAQCVVIDDFTTGKYQAQLDKPSATTNNYSDPEHVQAGTMLGGSRETAFMISGNPFSQIAELSILNNSGMLVIGSGVRDFFRLDLVYGETAALRYRPVDCDRFRVSFDSSSQQGLNFNIVVWEAGGPTYALGINVLPTTAGQPFCVDFPFDRFVTNSGPIPESFAGKGINALDLVLQSGAAVGANAFAMHKVETVNSSTAAAKPCAFVANNH